MLLPVEKDKVKALKADNIACVSKIMTFTILRKQRDKALRFSLAELQQFSSTASR